MPSKKQEQAYAEVRRALRSGELAAVQDHSCAHCGKGAAEYHHPNYDEPLNVVPLCNLCHMREHGRTNDSNMIAVRLHEQHVRKMQQMVSITGWNQGEIIRRLLELAVITPPAAWLSDRELT